MKSTQSLNLNQNGSELAKTAYLKSQAEPNLASLRVHDEFCIGRDPNCEIVLSDSYISRKHAQFRYLDGQYYLRDLDSQNGCFVNEIRVKEVALAEGDSIRFGRVYFRFSYFDGTQQKQRVRLKSANQKWAAQLSSLTQIAQSEENVLLQGESGTGKEIISRYLHDCSTRSQEAFVTLNCSNFNQNLIESELFGHTKGSFTDAQQDRKGAFLEANGGTLFLDEIGDMPLELQAKLLRVLENREVKPLGSDKNIAIDVRIIAASHKVLSELVKEGLFRLDLYYRLNIIEVKIPALRERREDFMDLILDFSREHKVNYAANTIQELAKLDWPGNIRELKNFVRRTAALFPHELIQPEHLNSLIHENEKKSQQSKVTEKLPILQKIERQVIEQSLIQYYGNQRRAAQSIGMAKSTFYDKVKKYQIDLNRYKPQMPN